MSDENEFLDLWDAIKLINENMVKLAELCARMASQLGEVTKQVDKLNQQEPRDDT